jgi:hypothetical protein
MLPVAPLSHMGQRLMPWSVDANRAAGRVLMVLGKLLS